MKSIDVQSFAKADDRNILYFSRKKIQECKYFM